MDPTGPARTQRSFAAKKSVRVRAGPCRVRVRVRVVEFSYYQTTYEIRRVPLTVFAEALKTFLFSFY